MEIFVNDQAKYIADNSTLYQIIDQLQLENAKGIAVAVNDLVIPRTAWSNHLVKHGDNILLIKATQGG